MTVRINPSLLAADFGNLTDELQRIANADFIHYDVMDNHFVPNLTMGPTIAKRVLEISPIPMDVHLMVDDPEVWAPVYAKMGASCVTFHIEAIENPIPLIDELHTLGVRAGLALRPATPPEAIAEYLSLIDLVLVMTVEPGFGGQSFMPETLDKVEWLDQQRKQHNHPYWLQVDGGINLETVVSAAAAGADTFVAGSSVYGADNPTIMVEELRHLSLGARNEL